MLKITNDDELNKFIFTSNVAEEELSKINQKKYSNKVINGFTELISKEKPNLDEIIEFMLNNNINLKETTELNYRQIIVLYSNKIPIEEVKKMLQYQKLENILLRKVIPQKEDYLLFLNLSYKDSQRQKGNQLKLIFKNFQEKELKEDTIFKNKILYSYEEVLKLENNEDFIYVPEDDNYVLQYLKSKDIYLENEKGRDILIRKNGYYFIGESKELNEEGGTQNNQYNDILSCINETSNENKVIGFGILFGVCLLYKNKYQKGYESNPNIIALHNLIFNFEEEIKTLKKCLNDIV